MLSATTLFGASFEEFADLERSFVTLFSAMLSGSMADDSYDRLADQYPVIFRLFFVVFLLLFVLILVNLNNAILNAAYVDAVREGDERAKLERRQKALKRKEGREGSVGSSLSDEEPEEQTFMTKMSDGVSGRERADKNICHCQWFQSSSYRAVTHQF